ncbi:hypothetical protein ACUL41_03245 [Virgibacillus natechei]
MLTTNFKYSVSDRSYFIDFLIILYFCLKPIYIFSSGGIQPADLIIVFLFLIFIYIRKFKKVDSHNLLIATGLQKVILITSIFVAWTFIVNSMYYYILNDITIIKPVLYYLYNLLVIVVIYQYFLIYGDRIYKLVKFSIVISLFIQLVLYFVLPLDGSRVVILFNNPNQLAHFSLIMLTFLLILTEKKLKIYEVMAIMISLFLILLSNSSSAILGAIFTIIFYIFFKKYLNKFVKWSLIIFLMFIVLLMETNQVLVANIPLLDEAVNRIENKEVGNSGFIEERGYGRVAEMGYNFVWGMGEGQYDRFSYLNGAELHSTIVGTFVNYGLIGVSLFIFILWKGFCVNKWKYLDKLILLSGILIYWFAHQGIRNSLFWILLAIYSLYIHSEIVNNRKKKE